jgi:hypothetical protein
MIIKKSLLSDILSLLSDKGYISCPDYDISINFEEVGKFSCKIKRPTYSKREFIIKYPEQNKDKPFYDMLMEYLFVQYDFELDDWSKENDIPLLETCVLFSILHEFGHIINYINRLNQGGDLAHRTEMDELSKYWEVSKITDLKTRFTKYRQIDNEMHADEIAMMLMERHHIELAALL